MKKICGITFLILMSLIFTGMASAMDNPVNIHGFIAQGYLKTSDNNFIQDSEDGSFQLNEMGINFTSEPVDKLRIGMQFFANDFGSVGNDDIVLDWAYADYRFFDFLGVRGGKIKNPVGLYQEVRDLDMLRTSVFLPISGYDEYLRNTANGTQGIGIYGDINTDKFGSFNYQMIMGTTNIPEGSGEALFLGIGQFDITNVDLDTILSYAFVWSDPTGMVRVGQTAWFADLTADGTMLAAPSVSIHYLMKNIEIYASSFEFTWNDLVFTYERWWNHSQLELFVSGAPTGRSARNLLGQFWRISYRVSDLVTLGYYYTEYFDNEGDRKGQRRDPAVYGTNAATAWHKESVFSVRLDINANWIFKIDYHYVDGNAKLLAPLNPEGMKHHWHMYAAKVSYNF